MDTNTVLLILNALVLLGQIALGLLLKNYLPAYATEKGKNLATKEDIEEITRKVEGVKDDFAKGRDEIAHQNRQVLDYMNRRHQLRLAALDKRLAVHQEAYILWWRIQREKQSTEKVKKIVRECVDWWGKNCLYLEKNAERAFRNMYHYADNIDETQKGWQQIIEAGDIIRRAVELPSLSEDEYNLFQAGDGNDGQPAKPDSAG